VPYPEIILPTCPGETDVTLARRSINVGRNSGSLRIKERLELLRRLSFCIALLIALFVGTPAWAADPPDTLTLTDGEILIGKLVRSSGSSLAFHSDSAGDVTIPWSKVKGLTSSRNFAVIPKGLQIKEKESEKRIPLGAITVTDQLIRITPGGGQQGEAVPTGDAAFVLDEDSFRKALHNPGFIEDWKGAISGGISLVLATQKSETYTSTAHLARAIPAEDWLAPRSRTLVNFLTSYGKVHQPNTPEVKTDLFRFDVEQDEYFSSRLYALGQAAFDHNFSSGLTLQQVYSGGIGWTVLKSEKQTLDLKSMASYISQNFTEGTTKNLIGSVFGETYHRDLAPAIKFDEQITLVPAWNVTSAYSANGGAGITLALYKQFGLNFSALNTFLNNPPPGFKKNSFQFITGVTYSLP
jgi:hypothetical protein